MTYLPDLPTAQALQALGQTLNTHLASLELARARIEDTLAAATQTEIDVRRLGLRDANHLVDSGLEDLGNASQHQQNSNEAFLQLRQQLSNLCTCIAVVKAELDSLYAHVQTPELSTQKVW